ncbi:hypothetical protein M595_1136 [Lyngbya aestuarii BL J]|uniref:Uncharacterized protein n=1 Tax=Lyngbya aestuarii BL J TaxID=1348334 RepID=U7QP84_9CYAN|nr:hypothetical protein [Lyngbya aestuarii]ERT08890.1 hypothetical protein M595_1136 [Lyngbya aestuarii BL J]
MESESTKANQLSRPQIVGVVVATTLIGGFLLSLFTSGRDQPVEEVKTIPTLREYPQSQPPEKPKVIEPIEPISSTENTVVLVPETQAEIDCVLGGGGAACFDDNYQPNYPTTSNQEEWEDWERSQREKNNLIKRLFR